MHDQLRRLAREERGAVLTIFAISIPTLILFAALALDVGNWYVHKRQLQNRVDSAVLAAALSYGTLYPACAATTSLEDEVSDTAKQYAGATGVPGAVNTEVNEPTKTTVLVNSAAYDGTSSGDGTDGGAACHPHPGGDDISPTVGGIDPTWMDVKAIETNVATLFGGFGVPVPAITANARVALMQPESLTGLRPFAAADPRLTECAWAIFNGANIPDVQLTGAPGSMVLSAAVPQFQMPSDNVSVDVRLGDCNEPAKTILYQKVGYINSYGGQRFAGIFLTPQAPCQGYFVPRSATSCEFGIRAHILNLAPNSTVFADVGGNAVELEDPDNDDMWTSIFTANVAAGSGSAGDGTIPIYIFGSDGGVNAIQFGGPGDPLHSIMAGDDTQVGPLADVHLTGPLSYNRTDDTVDTTITIDLSPLVSALPGDLPVALRAVVAGAHGLTGPVTCPATSFAEAIANGCPAPLTPTGPTAACPSAATCDVTVAGSGSSSAYDDAWKPGGTCTANNWALYPEIPRGDPRLITVAVSPVGAAYAAGQPQHVAGFAAFYVTGWDGDSCAGDDKLADLGQLGTTADIGAELFGHFVKFVAQPSSGTPSSLPCDSQGAIRGVSTCLATLVR